MNKLDLGRQELRQVDGLLVEDLGAQVDQDAVAQLAGVIMQTLTLDRLTVTPIFIQRIARGEHEPDQRRPQGVFQRLAGDTQRQLQGIDALGHPPGRAR